MALCHGEIRMERGEMRTVLAMLGHFGSQIEIEREREQ